MLGFEVGASSCIVASGGRNAWTPAQAITLSFTQVERFFFGFLREGPEGYAPRRGRRNFYGGHPNGSYTAHISQTAPGGYCPRQRLPSLPVTIFVEGLGALTKPGCLLRRPLRGAYPSGPRCNAIESLN